MLKLWNYIKKQTGDIPGSLEHGKDFVKRTQKAWTVKEKNSYIGLHKNLKLLLFIRQSYENEKKNWDLRPKIKHLENINLTEDLKHYVKNSS